MNVLDSTQGTPRVRLSFLLPFLLMALIGTANMFFCAMSIIPQWQIREELTAQVESGEISVAQMEQQATDDSVTVLQAQINRALTNLNEAVAIFMTEDQGYARLGRLYTYASESGTEVITVRSQPSTELNESDGFEIRVWRLQVEGYVLDLMDFIVLIREATIPSVVITNLSVTEIGDARSSLVMDILIYISPYASGEAFSNLR